MNNETMKNLLPALFERPNVLFGVWGWGAEKNKVSVAMADTFIYRSVFKVEVELVVVVIVETERCVA